MENNVVEQNKNKNLIIGVMACIIVLLIAALVYFVFIRKDKPEEPPKPQDSGQVNNNEGNNQDNNNNSNGNNISQEDDNINYDAWMNYLLTKDDLKVSVHRERYADDYVTNTVDKNVELSKDQVKGLFAKLKNLKLVNRCSSGRGSGDPNYDSILYTYSVNGTKYEFSMSGMDYLWIYYDEKNVDKSLLDVLDKSKDAKEGTEYDSCVYEFDDFRSSFLDEYFK